MSLKKTILLAVVGTASAAVGVAVPLVMSGGTKIAKADADSPTEKQADDHSAAKPGEHTTTKGKAEAAPSKSEHGAAKTDSHGKRDGHGDAVLPTGPQFVSFGRIVVNLNEPSLTKYLSLDITLQVDAKDQELVRRMVLPPANEAPSEGKEKDKGPANPKFSVESRLPILRTWLTSHLADKSIEDVRGKVGVNRLRREIQDQFNVLMFDDGRERVRDVLFEEFHIE